MFGITNPDLNHYDKGTACICMLEDSVFANIIMHLPKDYVYKDVHKELLKIFDSNACNNID